MIYTYVSKTENKKKRRIKRIIKSVPEFAQDFKRLQRVISCMNSGTLSSRKKKKIFKFHKNYIAFMKEKKKTKPPYNNYENKFKKYLSTLK